MTRLVAATGNAGKLREFARILEPLGIEVLSAAACGVTSEAEETGATFAENAHIKAWEIFHKTGLPSLADDSGLCVDALGGRPGVYSARYHGADATYPEKNAALLRELAGVEEQKRSARFHCAICCVLDEATTLQIEETCEGRIGFAPSGEGGFGYDPVFYVEGCSFAEISGAEKDRISHRGKALRKLAGALAKYLDKGETSC